MSLSIENAIIYGVGWTNSEDGQPKARAVYVSTEIDTRALVQGRYVQI